MALETFHGEVPGLAFDPSGRTLAAACQGQFTVLWDLAYADRHIAGNLEYWAARLGAQPIPGVDRLRRWADGVRARAE
jgi:hypothetical protein